MGPEIACGGERVPMDISSSSLKVLGMAKGGLKSFTQLLKRAPTSYTQRTNKLLIESFLKEESNLHFRLSMKDL